MGAFAETFGIRPWEWDQLPLSEVEALIGYIERQNKEANDG